MKEHRELRHLFAVQSFDKIRFVSAYTSVNLYI